MSSQLVDVPGTVTREDGTTVYLHRKPGLFATWVYPVAVLIFFIAGQPLAVWLTLAAGVHTHGVRYPRVFDVSYPVYFYLSALLVIVLPVLHLMLALATGVTVTDGR